MIKTGLLKFMEMMSSIFSKFKFLILFLIIACRIEPLTDSFTIENYLEKAYEIEADYVDINKNFLLSKRDLGGYNTELKIYDLNKNQFIFFDTLNTLFSKILLFDSFIVFQKPNSVLLYSIKEKKIKDNIAHISNPQIFKLNKLLLIKKGKVIHLFKIENYKFENYFSFYIKDLLKVADVYKNFLVTICKGNRDTLIHVFEFKNGKFNDLLTYKYNFIFTDLIACINDSFLIFGNKSSVNFKLIKLKNLKKYEILYDSEITSLKGYKKYVFVTYEYTTESINGFRMLEFYKEKLVQISPLKLYDKKPCLILNIRDNFLILKSENLYEIYRIKI